MLSVQTIAAHPTDKPTEPTAMLAS